MYTCIQCHVWQWQSLIYCMNCLHFPLNIIWKEMQLLIGTAESIALWLLNWLQNVGEWIEPLYMFDVHSRHKLQHRKEVVALSSHEHKWEPWRQPHVLGKYACHMNPLNVSSTVRVLIKGGLAPLDHFGCFYLLSPTCCSHQIWFCYLPKAYQCWKSYHQ